MRAILTWGGIEQIQRRSTPPGYSCVATMMQAGQAPHALAQLAEANVNCRILPGHSAEQIRLELVRIFANPSLTGDR